MQPDFGGENGYGIVGHDRDDDDYGLDDWGLDHCLQL